MKNAIPEPHLPSTAAEYFGSMADRYDSLIRRAVPRYDEMQARLADHLPASAASIVELGCGTGNFTLEIARRHPEALLTIVDASAEMLSLADSRLRALQPPRAGAARFVAVRFEEVALETGTQDLAVSSISFHHVRDKGSLFIRLLDSLRRGGTFLLADQFRGATSEIHDLNWKRWLEFCREPGHCTEEEIRSLVEHAEAHDHYESIEDHFQMLRAAGFRSLDCVWRNWLWGIVVAQRP